MKIAISGKGGVGKTTIAASLARSFAQQGFEVYAIDGDPDANLASMLGIRESLRPLSDLQEVIAERVGGEGGLYTLNPEVQDVLDEYAICHHGVKFLQMGAVKKASSSCYCKENSFLRAIIDALLFDRDEVVILDMGAGIEHLTRGTARGVDVMLIVCEPTRISLETGKVIQGLADEAGIGTIKFIVNKVRTDEERRLLESRLGDALLLTIDYSPELLAQQFADSPEDHVLREASLIIEKLGKEGRH